MKKDIPQESRIMQWSAWKAYWLIVAGVALLLRMWHLEAESAWCDEVLSIQCLPAPDCLSFLNAAFRDYAHLKLSPLWYIGLYYWSVLGGISLPWLRCYSVCIGMLIIPAAVWVTHQLAQNPRAGRIVGALVALSLFQVYYAQEVRYYALLTLTATLSMGALIKGVHGSRAAWIANAFFMR